MAQSPEEKFAQTRTREAISHEYVGRLENPDLDSDRQEQLDKNRVPGPSICAGCPVGTSSLFNRPDF
jgi:hypothetical protein